MFTYPNLLMPMPSEPLLFESGYVTAVVANLSFSTVLSLIICVAGTRFSIGPNLSPKRMFRDLPLLLVPFSKSLIRLFYLAIAAIKDKDAASSRVVLVQWRRRRLAAWQRIFEISTRLPMMNPTRGLPLPAGMAGGQPYGVALALVS